MKVETDDAIPFMDMLVIWKDLHWTPQPTENVRTMTITSIIIASLTASRKEMCRVCTTVSYNKTNQMHQFLKFILGMKLYMFWAVPLSTIRSFSLYIQQWYMSYRLADSLQAGSGWNSVPS